MTEMKNMAYWRAKNMLPGINPNSEGNTDTPDGKSGSSPLQDETKKTKPVKASGVSVEDQIAMANKQFGGGVSIQPRERYNPLGGGVKDFVPGVEGNARTAFSTMSDFSGYKGYHSFDHLPYKEKHKLRLAAYKAYNKPPKRKQKTKDTP